MFCLRALYFLKEIDSSFFDVDSTDADASIDRGAQQSYQLCSILVYTINSSFLSLFLSSFLFRLSTPSRDKFKRALLCSHARKIVSYIFISAETTSRRTAFAAQRPVVAPLPSLPSRLRLLTLLPLVHRSPLLFHTASTVVLAVCYCFFPSCAAL